MDARGLLRLPHDVVLAAAEKNNFPAVRDGLLHIVCQMRDDGSEERAVDADELRGEMQARRMSIADQQGVIAMMASSSASAAHRPP